MKTKELKKRILKENKECLKMFKVLEKKLRNINKICKNQEYEVSGYILQKKMWIIVLLSNPYKITNK